MLLPMYALYFQSLANDGQRHAHCGGRSAARTKLRAATLLRIQPRSVTPRGSIKPERPILPGRSVSKQIPLALSSAFCNRNPRATEQPASPATTAESRVSQAFATSPADLSGLLAGAFPS